MNFSDFICTQILDLTSNISLAIRNVGEIIYNENICFSNLVQKINSTAYFNNNDLFSINGLIKSFISIGFINLLLSYSLRYILIKLFVLLSPFAFLTLIFEKTSWFFQAWLRGFLSLLLIQIITPLILLLTFSLDFSSSEIFVKILFLGCIYALIKANSIIKELIGGITSSVSINFRNLIRR